MALKKAKRLKTKKSTGALLEAESAFEQIQSDWAQTDDTKVDFIKNKPDLTLLAAKEELSEETRAREGVDEKLITKINELQTQKQDTLVSSVNIKTINNQSILGSGNIEVGGGTTNIALYLWPEGVALGTEKTFNMGTSKRIICKLFVSNSIYGPIYVQCPAYYVFDFSGEKGTTVFMNNYFAFDWKQVFSTYSSIPTQTYNHRKDDSLGVWGWFGLKRPSPSDESRQLRYVYDSTKNTITFAVADHNDLSYVLEVETI